MKKVLMKKYNTKECGMKKVQTLQRESCKNWNSASWKNIFGKEWSIKKEQYSRKCYWERV